MNDFMTILHDNDNLSEQYLNTVNRWRETVEISLRSADGWLSVVGLDWLNEGSNSVGGDPTHDVALPVNHVPDTIGTIDLDQGTVTLHITTDEPVFVNGVQVTTPTLLHDDTSEGGASLVKVRDVTFHIIKRGDAYGVRVRDPQSEARATFTGRNWFEIDPAYRVVGTFHPYQNAQPIDVDSIIGTKTTLNGLGHVTFELFGEKHRLLAFDGGKDQLWFILRDATSGQSTYGSGRFLMANLSEDGTVDLDFNKAHNPPCAFTPYATCPLPPRENHLLIALPVGEKQPS